MQYAITLDVGTVQTVSHKAKKVLGHGVLTILEEASCPKEAEDKAKETLRAFLQSDAGEMITIVHKGATIVEFSNPPSGVVLNCGASPIQDLIYSGYPVWTSGKNSAAVKRVLVAGRQFCAELVPGTTNI